MGNQPIGRMAAAAVAMVTACATLTVAAPAAQAVPGLQRVAASSSTDATSPKSVKAHCPRGTRVIDGGATISGGGGNAQVRLTGLAPEGDGFRATASAGTAGYRGQWRLTAYAICAYPLPGLGVSSGWDPPGMTDQWWKSFTGGCATGQKLLGFGAEVIDRDGNPATGVALQILRPLEDLTQWHAQAFRVDDDYHEAWALQGYSVCADPVPGQVHVVGYQEQPGVAVAKATCPRGTTLHAMGGLINAAPGKVALTGVYPSTDLTNTLAFAEEVAGGAGVTWQPISYAICAA
jgi:hypothetical protein